LITLTAGGAGLANFAPGSTATGSSTLTATDTSGSWTLQAQDLGSGSGKMVASAGGCTGSSATLDNPLQLSVSGALSGVAYAPAASLSSSARTVASATSAPMVTPTSFTANYTQVIPASQVLRTGCVYTITVTYTLQ
jgi:hypothetical protein